MQYSEFKNQFINKVYIPYMNDDRFMARTALANMYNNGKNNPRGTIYQCASAFGATRDMYKNTVAELKKAGKKDELSALHKKFKDFTVEISGSSHPTVSNALQRVEQNYKEMYPSQRTKSFTSFVILKQNFPILRKLKFLAKFL